MEYEIDAVRSTLMGLAPSNQNAWEMNNKCYSICASFNQGNDDQSLAPAFERNGIIPVAPLIPNVWNSTEKCFARCDQLLNKQRILQFGNNSCDHKAPLPPVIWEPRNFPLLLKRLGNKEDALIACNGLCDEVRNKEQCKMNCRDDYNSLVEKKFSSSTGEIQLDVVSFEEQDSSSKDDSVASLAGYSLILLGAVLFSYLVIRSRRKK